MFGYLWAFFRPYNINDTQKEAIKQRINPLNSTTSVSILVDRAEALISSLETKAGVLLTHISMMIAVTGIMLTAGSESDWYKLFLTIELSVYLILALVCIRCQSHFDANKLSRTHQQHQSKQQTAVSHVYQRIVYGELHFREWLFRRVQFALYLLTAALIVTVVVGLFSI